MTNDARKSAIDLICDLENTYLEYRVSMRVEQEFYVREARDRWQAVRNDVLELVVKGMEQ